MCTECTGGVPSTYMGVLGAFVQKKYSPVHRRVLEGVLEEVKKRFFWPSTKFSIFFCTGRGVLWNLRNNLRFLGSTLLAIFRTASTLSPWFLQGVGRPCSKGPNNNTRRFFLNDSPQMDFFGFRRTGF